MKVSRSNWLVSLGFFCFYFVEIETCFALLQMPKMITFFLSLLFYLNFQWYFRLIYKEEIKLNDFIKSNQKILTIDFTAIQKLECNFCCHYFSTKWVSDWFWQHVNLCRLNLCLNVRESHSLFIQIYIFCAVVSLDFFFVFVFHMILLNRNNF